MTIIAIGAVIGGIDKILGNRYRLGEKFDEGFNMMGPMALTMAGIICLSPLLTDFLNISLSLLLKKINIDPAVLGSVLAIDMGGYQLSMSLAQNTELGRFFGIICSAMFGCTMVFTIPVGMSVLKDEDKPFFLKGIIFGLVCLPAGLVIGGLVMGLNVFTVIYQSLPVLVLSLILLLGLIFRYENTIRVFNSFARLIQIVATFGLLLGAFQYISGITIVDNLTPLSEAMEVVASIAIVMLGSLPLAELLKRALKKPFKYIGDKTGLNDATTTGIIAGTITVMPALVMIKDMNPKGKMVIAAFLVCGASAIGAHMGFAAGCEPEMISALLIAKFSGAALSVILCLLFNSKHSK